MTSTSSGSRQRPSSLTTKPFLYHLEVSEYKTDGKILDRQDTQESTLKGRDLIETMILYVGVPALTLYPLGFVALGLEMLRDPFFPYYSFHAVWNAVSLVPQTVVIGTGVKLLYLSLISTALGAGIATVAYRYFHRLSRDGGGSSAPLPLIGWWRLYVIVLLPVAVFLLWNTLTVNGWNEIKYVVGFFALSIGSGVAMGYAMSRGQRSHFFAGLMVAYAGSVLAALCIAAIQSPQLPLVEVDAKANKAISCSEVQPEKLFVLLAESESYWYVYNEDGLLALPNQDAQTIRYRNCPGYLGRD